ncbi:MAG: SCO family protein [Gammaproteobacteria bacterium]|nr:SCO family protein [Gammaproteobacteria bacterium]
MSRFIGCVFALCLSACTADAPAFKGTDISAVDWGKDVTLTAHTGKPVATADFRGKVTLLFFGFTHCPDVCAPTLAKLAAVRKELGADAQRVQVLFVTVDPANDSPQQLAAFVPKFDPSFIGLTGTKDEIAAAAREYRIAYEAHGGQVSHSDAVLVKDANGKLRLLFKSSASVADIEHDIRLLLKNAA